MVSVNFPRVKQFQKTASFCAEYSNFYYDLTYRFSFDFFDLKNENGEYLRWHDPKFFDHINTVL